MSGRIGGYGPIEQAMQVTINALDINKKAFHLTTENLANADAVARPGEKPYQKKVVLVVERHNHQTGEIQQSLVVQQKKSAGHKIYDPDHPYADAQGNKTVSDVNATQELVNAMTYKSSADRLVRLHKMGFEMTKQELDQLDNT